jgi:hypothetical protein
MLVYRIEHPEDGLGPYRSVFSNTNKLLNMNAKHGVSSKHPVSCKDVYNKPSPDENFIGYCGFDCVFALKSWFRGYRKEMAREGFKMFVYDSSVDLTWISEVTRQVIFVKENADLLMIKDIP